MSRTLEIEKTSTLSALRSRDFLIYWTAGIVPNLGQWMQVFGQGYLVVVLAMQNGTPRLAPFYAGLVGLSQAIPGLSLGLLGGVVADRYDRRSVITATQLCLSVLTGAIAAMALSGRIGIYAILVVSALVSTVNAFDNPTRQSLIPDLVPRAHLVSAVGLTSASYGGALLVGPMLGGLLYLPLGTGGLFLVNALAYLVLPGALLFVRPGPRADLVARPARGGVVERPGPLRSIREGLTYIVRDPVVLWVVVLCVAAQFLVRPYTQLMPSFAEGVLHVGAVPLSWLLTASGGGGLVGAFVTASLGSLERRGRFMIVAAIAGGAALVLFAIQREVPGAIVAVAVLAFASALFQGAVNTMIQLRSPDRLRGRVLSVLQMIPLGIMPLGIAALGFAGTVTGVAVSLGVAGALFAVVSVLGRPFASDLWRWRDAS